MQLLFQGKESSRKFRSFLDISGLGSEGVTVLFCREVNYGYTILIHLVRFLPGRHLFVTAELSARSLQLLDVLTSQFDLMSRIIDKHIQYGQ